MILTRSDPYYYESEGRKESLHLLVMDSSKTALLLSKELFEERCTATFTRNPEHAIRVLKELGPEYVLLNIDEGSSAELYLMDEASYSSANVIVIGPRDIEPLVRKMVDEGRVSFFPQPVDRATLWSVLGQVSPAGGSASSKIRVRKTHEAIVSGSKLIGQSRPIQQVVRQIQRVAPTSATVLLTGESGTGKEVVAHAIHQHSARSRKPFLPINCGAISPHLIESELFGHEKGSFTGAVKEHRGVFERADGGTLFLDEISEMPIDLQVKLLRVLETQRFVRLGSDREQKTDVRIIAATNRCPETEVENGKLRVDLLYRIQVFPIWLPPLRERDGDIILLAQYFLSELNKEHGCTKSFTDKALVALNDYPWPGNIRELKNVVQRSFIMVDEAITADALPEKILHPTQSAQHRGSTLTVSIGTSVAEVEKNLIFATLDLCGGKKEKAAGILGVSVKTLYNRLREYEEKTRSNGGGA